LTPKRTIPRSGDFASVALDGLDPQPVEALAVAVQHLDHEPSSRFGAAEERTQPLRRADGPRGLRERLADNSLGELPDPFARRARGGAPRSAPGSPPRGWRHGLARSASARRGRAARSPSPARPREAPRTRARRGPRQRRWTLRSAACRPDSTAPGSRIAAGQA